MFGKKDDMKGMKILLLVFVLTMLAAFLWDKVPIIKQSVHAIANPTLGKLLDFNTLYGMFLIVGIFTLITTLIQKYFTDQTTLKEIKKEQKILQEEIKKYRDNPEKIMELNKKQLEFIPRTMEITMRPTIYTIIPLVLFFRWFSDYFILSPYKFFNFMTWFWFYLVFTIIFSMIFRKVFDVA
ncbi:MAG: EMC3/TMCO1 family protein [Nanoarchaeota archaeon]|nr:EMC3/TMCO1 family protein [Nanoarchaeota archaeon]